MVQLASVGEEIRRRHMVSHHWNHCNGSLDGRRHGRAQETIWVERAAILPVLRLADAFACPVRVTSAANALTEWWRR